MIAYDELELFGQREPDDSKHLLERITGVIYTWVTFSRSYIFTVMYLHGEQVRSVKIVPVLKVWYRLQQ